jgi:hypothetical protein
MLAAIIFWKFVVFALSTAEGAATLIAGLVAPIVAQAAKRLFGASGLGALAVTVVASALVAIAAMYWAGEIHSVGDALKQAMSIFGMATLVYKIVTAAETKTA